jgi:hypothetical protein
MTGSDTEIVVGDMGKDSQSLPQKDSSPAPTSAKIEAPGIKFEEDPSTGCEGSWNKYGDLQSEIRSKLDLIMSIET